jgi:hypothetical protein
MFKRNHSHSNYVEPVMCRNPFCNRQQKAFANESAFQKHLAVLPQCREYLMHHQQLQINAAASIATVKETPSTKQSVTIETSKKRTCVLRRDVVNVLNHHDKRLASPDLVGVLNNPLEHQERLQEFDDTMNDNASGWDDCDTGYFVSLKDHNFLHTTDQKWTVNLLKILDDMNAPDYAFGEILAWGRGAHNAGYSFQPTGGLSRSKNIDVLFDIMPDARKLLPTCVPLPCSDGSVGDVIIFDFVPQLLNLLQNPAIMIQTVDKFLVKHSLVRCTTRPMLAT